MKDIVWGNAGETKMKIDGNFISYDGVLVGRLVDRDGTRDIQSLYLEDWFHATKRTIPLDTDVAAWKTGLHALRLEVYRLLGREKEFVICDDEIAERDLEVGAKLTALQEELV